MNVEAIRTLKEIEFENRSATKEEQEILSRYVGWGSLPQAFDEHNGDWADEFTELYGLLSPEEYEAARASTLNAHYTSPVVIREIYRVLERRGLEKGNVLEPACGVGNFFGMLPESMSGVNLYGVEMDSISGRIAKQLYPEADIQISPFEKTDFPDQSFDVAIGNVPFGQYRVRDRRYEKENFLVHDYFIAKMLDKVRPGGVVAVITSKGTMDKASPEARRYLARRAELLGAVRLPNNAFLKNAGTEVTSDILFFQKRERMIDMDPDWAYLGRTDDGIPLNQYFADHPEMVLGTMTYDKSRYGNDKETACMPYPMGELGEQLREALNNIDGVLPEPELDDIAEPEDETIPADPNVKNYSYTLVDGEVYFRENSRMVRPELAAATKARIVGLIGLRDCVHELIDLQLQGAADGEIREKQAELNHLYDRFTAKHGLINSKGNNLAFAEDSSYYLLCSLEELDDEGRLKNKADMFFKRTIGAHQPVTSVGTASEALSVSIGEHACVDLGYMSALLGKPGKIEEVADELRGVIYKDPLAGDDFSAGWQTADEYLSGNVRQKLRVAEQAAADNPELYGENVRALQAVQPKDLDATEIEVRLGATWVPTEYIQQFMEELLEPPERLKEELQVLYSPTTGEWNITGKSRVSYNDVLANMTYGTSRMNAYQILENSLNLRDVRIYDTVRDEEKGERRVLNSNETTLARQRQELIREAFKDWIWKDAERRQTLTERYNETFNAYRPREYDGQHIKFTGSNPEIELRDYQANAAARIIYGGNTLLAHEVGLGKTFIMIAAAMESKRLGLCQKSMFVVPNYLTEQWASDILKLYPGANILVTRKKDFEKCNRKKFCAKIATGNYDAIVIGHSQFERIPVSKERQERLLQEQIDEITQGLEELAHQDGVRFTVKQMEKTKKNLEARLDRLHKEERKDDVVTFEQLGVDRLFIDEGHNYKNLYFHTKMRNVAGISQTDAQKSSDMLMKCRYMDELTGGKGTIIATGTPVSNSMTELYTMQRYLQHEALIENGLTHFDSWAAQYGETTTTLELAAEGTYRPRTRFARFFNLPELMLRLKEVADIQLAESLNLPRPEAKFETVVAQPSEYQQEMIEKIAERAEAIHKGKVKPEQDNMLKITTDGKKLGLDQRLLNPLLPDEPGSKVNLCVENVYRIWEQGSRERLTQVVFCDTSTPKGDGSFDLYNDVKKKLMERGVPEQEIAFIHDANTDRRKAELFQKVREGRVRVLLGSTPKLGAGVNIQDRLAAIHDLDAPWRPGDLEQRAGRAVRQGNCNPLVHIFRYVTKGTFDSFLYQMLENKQRIISQIMTSRSPVRSCEDVDAAVLNYAQVKALCAGNPLIMERMNLEIEVSKLKLLKGSHQSQQYRLEDDLTKNFPRSIKRHEEYLAAFDRDAEHLRQAMPKEKGAFAGMEIDGVHYDQKALAGEAILAVCKKVKRNREAPIGHYLGLPMYLAFSSVSSQYELTLKGQMNYTVPLGTDAIGNLTRIHNAFANIPNRRKSVEQKLTELHRQVEQAKAEIGKPFPKEQELQEKTARMLELDMLLNAEARKPRKPREYQEPEVAKAERPSLLQRLKSLQQKEPQEQPPRRPDMVI